MDGSWILGLVFLFVLVFVGGKPKTKKESSLFGALALIAILFFGGLTTISYIKHHKSHSQFDQVNRETLGSTDGKWMQGVPVKTSEK